MELRKKNTIVFVCPYQSQLLKAIYNALVINIINIVIIGDKEIIQEECSKINLDSDMLYIIDCKGEDIYEKVKILKVDANINCLVMGNVNKRKVFEMFSKIIDIKIINLSEGKRRMYIINRKHISINNDNFDVIKELITNSNIKKSQIGLVIKEKNKAVEKEKKIYKKCLKIKSNLIFEEEILSGRHNILLFEERKQYISFIDKINKINDLKQFDIKKASRKILIDANNKSFQNIFSSILFLSKWNFSGCEINSQVF